jgi:disulfide oxidoreductase YuzD
MRYMIVRWNKDTVAWDVLHYSNSLKDAERWYKEYVLKYPDCSFMLDYHQINLNKFANELRALAEKFKEARCLN